jgi:hypothetical protein
MGIEFETTDNSLKVSFCSEFEMYFDFGEEIIIRSGVFVIRAMAKKPSHGELYLYHNDDGLFVIKNGKSIKVRKKFRYNKDGLDVKINLIWEVQNEN